MKPIKVDTILQENSLTHKKVGDSARGVDGVGEEWLCTVPVPCSLSMSWRRDEAGLLPEWTEQLHMPVQVLCAGGGATRP